MSSQECFNRTKNDAGWAFLSRIGYESQSVLLFVYPHFCVLRKRDVLHGSRLPAV